MKEKDLRTKNLNKVNIMENSLHYLYFLHFTRPEKAPSLTDDASETDVWGPWLRARGVKMLRSGFQIDLSSVGDDWLEAERLKDTQVGGQRKGQSCQYNGPRTKGG